MRRASVISQSLAAAGLAAALTAADAPVRFRFEREAQLAAGPQRLAVDAGLLVGASPFRVDVLQGGSAGPERRVARDGLADLRFYDEAGAEVPHLLVEAPAGEPEWRPAQTLVALPASKKESGFEIDLGSLETVDRVRLRGLPPPFLKRVTLDGSGDRRHWARLVAEATLFDLPDASLRQHELAFAAGAFRYLRLTWDDRSSARVPLPIEAGARLARADAPARPPATAPVRLERRPSEPGRSRFALFLPGPALPVVALRLSVRGGNLLRATRVSEARLSGGGAIPVEVGAAVLRRTTREALAADELRIPIQPLQTAQLDLTVDDGDNPPLEIDAVAAELAELPWIYIEPVRPGRIVARWGRPGSAAPRYDLESQRERVSRSLPPSGRWLSDPRPAREMEKDGARQETPGPGAVLDVAGFRFSRRLAEGPGGLAVVPLDPAVLAHSAFAARGELADVRVVDADSRQIPYLLDRRPEPLVVPLPPLVPAPELASRFPAGTTVYRLRLPLPGLPRGELVLRTRARVFTRDVTVLEQPPRRRSRHTPALAMGPWRHASPDTAAPALTLTLPGQLPSELLLTLNDGDNRPLPLDAAELLLPAWHLRLFRTGPGELRVLYGQRRLAPPSYDLALLASAVLARPARVTPLLAEEERAQPGRALVPTPVFWAFLALAVLVLLGLIAHLLRRDSGTS